MNIAVIGTGYVGLVSGTCFAEMGNHVTCVDIDEDKIAGLTRGEIPIYEPGLSELVLSNHRDGRLKFTTSLEDAVHASRMVFIAVGTPSAEDGSADLSAVFAVAEAIGKAADGPKLIVDKSTVPVGTAAKVKAVASEASTQSISVCSNPEFLKEGAAIEDFMKPDRVVIGAESEEDFELMEELYAPFVRSGKPILRMDPPSAEMTKYASNAMLATRISFMNEIARLCSLTSADVSQVRQGMGTDTRIGQPFLYPGIGYGGSCFPKDVEALIHTAGEHGYAFRILEAVVDVNRRQKSLMAEKAVELLGEDLSGKRIALWGLAFKLTFLSGVTKLTSGDPTWRNFSALQYHYETQPLPNWISWHLHNTLDWFGVASVAFMFVIEIVISFVILFPPTFRKIRIIVRKIWN